MLGNYLWLLKLRGVSAAFKFMQNGVSDRFIESLPITLSQEVIQLSPQNQRWLVNLGNL